MELHVRYTSARFQRQKRVTEWPQSNTDISTLKSTEINRQPNPKLPSTQRNSLTRGLGSGKGGLCCPPPFSPAQEHLPPSFLPTPTPLCLCFHHWQPGSIFGGIDVAARVTPLSPFAFQMPQRWFTVHLWYPVQLLKPRRFRPLWWLGALACLCRVSPIIINGTYSQISEDRIAA